MSITITNKKICDFYTNYPNINIENLLCNFIDLIEKFAGDNNNVSEERIIESVSTIKNTLGDINNGNLENFKSILKLNAYENKDDINKILSTITNKNSELFYKNKDETIKHVSELITKNKELISKDNDLTFQKMLNVFPPDLIEEMKDYFGKNKTSAFKGQQSENKVETLLNNIFKDAEIVNMSKICHSGDFHLKRSDKDTIIIENKDYQQNVGYDSVTKFNNDCSDLDMHGIMLSQHTGISTKRDWSVEIINNKILVYLVDVEYNGCKILSAVSLIDNLSSQLNKFADDNNINNNININQEDMVEINDELRKFITSKLELYKTVTRNEKSLRDAIENIQLPKLTTFFTGKCDALPTWECPFCLKQFPTKGKQGSHSWRCDKNPDKPISTKKSEKKPPKNSKKQPETGCIDIQTIDNDSSDD
jgi:hypothetical protein